MKMSSYSDNAGLGLSAFVQEQHAGIRQFLATGLRQAGFRHVESSAHFEEAKQAMASGRHDLMLFDGTQNMSAIIASIRAARDQNSGADPFGVFVVNGDPPSASGTQSILASGCDAFVVRPFSTDSIGKRLDWLYEQSRTFVVTADYIGPERRGAPRDETFTRRVSVPNTLKAKKNGSFDPAAHRIRINKAMFAYNAYVIEREAMQIEAAQNGAEDDATYGAAHRSQMRILQLVRRLANTVELLGQDRLKPMLAAVSDLAGRRIEDGPPLSANAARELQGLSAHLAEHVTKAA